METRVLVMFEVFLVNVLVCVAVSMFILLSEMEMERLSCLVLVKCEYAR